MTEHVAQTWLAVGCGVGLLLCGCAPIEHAPELRQASDRLERASGLQPAWEPEGGLREFQPDAEGVVALEHALELALANNRALRADLERIGEAKADLVQAGLLSNPMLNLMLRFPEAGGRAMFDFGLAQNLADLWLIPSRRQAAQAMLQERLLAVTDTALGLIYEVRTTYSNLQYLSLAIELEQQNLAILREASEVAQARLRAGQGSQLDVNLLEGRRLETELALLQLRSDQRITQQTLLRLMGVARAPDTWQPQPLTLHDAPALAADEAKLIDAALVRRLDVLAAWWELEAAAADFQQQVLRFLPNLTIGVAGERTESRGLPERKILAEAWRSSLAAGRPTVPELETPSQRRLERSQMIDLLIGPALDVPLPIFDQNQAQVAKAQYRTRELRQRYEELEQRVIEGVRAALATRRLAEDKVRVYRESLMPLQESNLRLAEAAYQAGRESILTVLLAQEALIRTRLGHAAAARDLAASAAGLERQMAGRLSEIVGQEPEAK